MSYQIKKIIRTYFIVVFTIAMFLGITSVKAQQNSQNSVGYIIKVDEDKVYLNLPNVKISDIVSIFDNGGYMTDPRTGQSIRTIPETVGQIKIIAVQGKYSVGRIYGNLANYPQVGMTVRKETIIKKNDYGETTVMIAPAELNWPKGENALINNMSSNEGYIGDYISAALTQHLLESNKIQVVDRSIFGAYQQQVDGMTQQEKGVYEKEMDLKNNGTIDPNTALENGKMSGVRYLVKITLQKPDIVYINNEFPVEGVANAFMGRRKTKVTQYLPANLKTTNVKVSVRIVAHLVDLQTGKELFISNGIGTASGKPQIDLEWSNYNNNIEYSNNNDYNNSNISAKINNKDKDVDFTQTITGKAIDNALEKIGKELRNYFEENL